MNKNAIKKRFDAAHASYDDVAGVQKLCAGKLMTLLQIMKKDSTSFCPDSVLDLGAGTGYLSQKLFEQYPNAPYTLVDLSQEMLSTAQQKFPRAKNFSYVVADMETSDFANTDLIMSNLAMQWLNDLESFIQDTYHRSNIFMFSTLLKGTFSEWESLLAEYGIASPVKNYPTNEQMIKMCKGLKPDCFYTDIMTYKIPFNSARDFMKYLRALGASYSSWPFSMSNMRRLLKNETSPFHITYSVFFCILRRN